MLLVHSAVNNRICKLTFFCKLLCTFKAHILAEAKAFHSLFSSDGIRVGNAYNFQHFRVCFCKLTVYKCSVTCTYNYGCNRFLFHFATPLLYPSTLYHNITSFQDFFMFDLYFFCCIIFLIFIIMGDL